MAKHRKSAAAEKSILRDAREIAAVEQYWHVAERPKSRKPPANYKYVDELARLQFELIKLQEWVRSQGLQVAVVFEGRDAAGKGGVIKRITESLNPRICRIVALGTPTERERGQWYFQRYVAQLPAGARSSCSTAAGTTAPASSMSWASAPRRSIEDSCAPARCSRSMLVRSGIFLVKYWFSVNDEEQERRFQERIRNPIKRWKLSPMDLESRKRWVEYSQGQGRDVRAHRPQAHPRGTSSTPTTRSAPGSTASATFWIKFRIRT